MGQCYCRVTNQVDASGVSIATAYDPLGRIISRTYPDSGVERFNYSARGLIAHTNQLGNVTRYAYDAARRKIAETNANTEVTQLGYNAAGDLLTLSDGKSQMTAWNYDRFGRVTNKVDAASLVILRYKYDADNRLTNRWSAAKGDTFYTYDSVGNLTFVNYPTSPDITLAYDALNHLTNLVDAVGTTRYNYDSVGQLLSEDGPWENDMVNLTYQDRLRTGLSVQAPNASPWTQSYGYDAARRLSNVLSSAGTFSYRYGPVGTEATPSPLVRKLSLPSGSYITNVFDSSGRMTETKLRSSGGSLLNEHSYVYDAAGRRLIQTRSGPSYVGYSYDSIGQLKSAVGQQIPGPGGTTNRWQELFGYAYDAAG